MKAGKIQFALFIIALTALVVGSCSSLPTLTGCGSGAGKVEDEAQCVGRTPESLAGADEDYFQDMDYGMTKDPQAVAAALEPYLPGVSPTDAKNAVVRGRNNWIVWTGGNDRFWDEMINRTVGTFDLLKVLSNHPSLNYSRDNRWYYLGLVNEPCFEKGSGPREDRYGLWLDVREAGCEPDPFENEDKYPGVKIGARGKTVPIGSYYGYGSGIVGLRLLPNPDFDAKAESRWDSERYYTDPKYYDDKDLVRPYRVGMSCGFCHVGPNPSNPPTDPENPEWENLNSNPGAQYFWVDRIFIWDVDPSDFPYQLFHTSRPGALDTSLVSTDYINNPRTMNAVYNLGARMEIARKLGKEYLSGGEQDNEQLNQHVPEGTPLTAFYEAPDKVWTPRVLKDGADSVGGLGALNRVYINIGLFSEEWLEHFKPLVGGKPFTPFEIAVANKNSAYWNATEKQTPDLALFFLATGQPDLLSEAPGGDAHLTKDAATLNRGKTVFAETCARCHSSKLPEKAFSFFRDDGCVGPNYLQCWNNYWSWTKTNEFRNEMRTLVAQPDFHEENFLSTELRVPVTLLETNACSSLATNALKNDIWDNFSSTSYKALPPVGSVTVHHPVTGDPRRYEMPAGGRGYIRPPSLISLWSTAPFLLSNSMGDFYWSGSVDDRIKSFDSGIQRLLWPEQRKGERTYVTASGKQVPGVIDRTTATSYLRVPKGYVPDVLQPLVGLLSRTSPEIANEEGLELGPIPKGTPINLIANIDLALIESMDLKQKKKVLDVLLDLKQTLKALPETATDEEARQALSKFVEPMLKVSKCPDFVVNRGHYFGTEYFAEEPGLSDKDKWALIEYLKTL